MATPPCILVVNDSQEILTLFRTLLEDEGYEVELLSYVPHELLAVERLHPDLIVMDLISEDEQVGMQLLNKLRLKQETAAIPVIVVTAATSALRENAGYLKAHRVTVVAKPCTVDHILAAIKHSLAPSV